MTAIVTNPVQVMADPKMAAKFRKLAESCNAKVANLRRDRNTNTPKRQCEAMGARCEAGNLERTAKALEALAAGWETGTLPPEFAGIKDRKTVEGMVTRIIEHPSYYVVSTSDRWRDDSPAAVALRAYVTGAETADDKRAEAERARQDRIMRMEDRVRFLDIPGFFPTPPALIARMIEAAEIRPGMKVLEPSAGKGDIADAIERACPAADVLCYEVSSTLADICDAKGHKVMTVDFLKMFSDEQGGARFDRVLMNPPFEKWQDMAHVRHAFGMLSPGGRLVAIIGAGAASNERARGFQVWLEEVGAEVEDVDAGAFAGRDSFRQTGVACKLVTICKPR